MKNHVWVMGNYYPFHKKLQRERQLLGYKQYSELRIFTKIGHFLLTLIDMQNIFLQDYFLLFVFMTTQLRLILILTLNYQVFFSILNLL